MASPTCSGIHSPIRSSLPQAVHGCAVPSVLRGGERVAGQPGQALGLREGMAALFAQALVGAGRQRLARQEQQLTVLPESCVPSLSASPERL